MVFYCIFIAQFPLAIKLHKKHVKRLKKYLLINTRDAARNWVPPLIPLLKVWMHSMNFTSWNVWGQVDHERSELLFVYEPTSRAMSHQI